ncbi:hypothetical protein KR009_000946 [Drosophila setifemur]|nr:hypothetical protein KR009_000946 [Drosophila setifemur]
MKYRIMNKRKQATPSPVRKQEEDPVVDQPPPTYSALEFEAAAALLMLRYQYDRQACNSMLPNTVTTSPNSPAVVVDNTTPKDQPVRPTVSTQPLKKRSIPAYLMRRSLTPAKAENSVANTSMVKAKNKKAVQVTGGERTCKKTLLKSCRNMICEFLDNQELI